MSINGKRDNFVKTDLEAMGDAISIPKPMGIMKEVMDAVKAWPDLAKKAGVPSEQASEIAKHHRIYQLS